MFNGPYIDAVVSRFDELDSESPVVLVGLDVCRDCWGREVIEQREEVVIALQCFTEWAGLESVVASDALKGEVEPVA
jgi:hypothetical protein